MLRDVKKVKLGQRINLHIRMFAFAYRLVLLVMIIFTISVQETLAQVNSGLIPIVTSKPLIQEFPVPSGSHPHDVVPAKNGSVWYTAQGSGQLGQIRKQARLITFH